MPPHDFTEDQLVEQPAIGLFAALGWLVAGSDAAAGEGRNAALLGGNCDRVNGIENGFV